MASATGQPPKTIRDLLALGAEVRAELIHGEILRLPSRELKEHNAVAGLASPLSDWAKEGGRGWVFLGPLDVYLPSGDVVEPDVLFIRPGGRAVLDRWVRGVPDLLVEVLSPTSVNLDRRVKRELYERNGVPEYWIVDPDARSIEVLRLEGATYCLQARWGEGEILVSPSLPGFELDVAELFTLP